MIESLRNLSLQNRILILSSLLVYILLAVLSINHCYFWDTVQQISKEAHWFYLNGFNTLIIPDQASEYGIMTTGYHLPLMGIMTAVLWNIFGYELWVSYIFTLLWSLILIYNLWKLILHFFDKKYSGIILFILLVDVTILSQFSISSPDFIMFTSFIISIRAILEKKMFMLAIGLFFLSCINMRGVIALSVIFISNIYYEYLIKEKNIYYKSFLQVLYPYIPVVIILAAYYCYYFYTKGWFFTDNSAYREHYARPESWYIILKNISAFILRSVENGRVIIWALFFYFLFYAIKSKKAFSNKIKFLFCNIILLYSIYFLFAYTTQMPFSSRYFLPQFTLVALITLMWTIEYSNSVKTVNIILSLIFVFRITGHFWIYPDKMAQEWDGKLTHFPYYKLRKECFEYIDKNQLSYDEISAGTCFYGDRGFTELDNHGKIISSQFGRKYFIYSNISNNSDYIIDELQDKAKWQELKKFEKRPVHVIIYEKVE
jgi:hypothetical protein